MMQPNITSAGQGLDVKNLSSRKLFELLSVEDTHALNQKQLQSVMQELVLRKHYLIELNNLYTVR